jgi:outer membrane receptor for ferrienterochelin and colicins
MYKIENQNDFSISKRINLTTGIGYVYENVRSSRYDNESNLKESKVGYAFLQSEINCTKRFTTILGLRYDNNSNYQSAFAPKISFSFKPNSKLHFTASVGYGFKVPDFRQLYLNFTNAAAGGYTVLGTIEASKIIAQLQQQGQIGSLSPNYYNITILKPEKSVGINIGGTYSPNNKTRLNLNFFRNNLDNLIENAQVATYKTGAQIYSYINLNKAFTQGAEFNLSHKISNQFTIDIGYQLLFSGNTDEIDRIKQGLVYTKNADGSSRKMALSDYFGLANRSRHIANAKLLYEKDNFYANLRVLYHSRWAVNDKNGNGVFDTNDEFASGYALVNITAGYNVNKHFGLQIGCNNITDYTDLNYLPTQMGRSFFLTINYN